MRLSNRSTKPIALACALLAMTALPYAWSKWNTEAAMPRECPSCFQSTGMFDVSFGEVAKASIVNTGAPRGLIINWRVLDATGNAIADSGHHSVAFNQAASFEFLPSAGAARQGTPIRVEVTVEVSREDVRGIREEHLFIPTVEVSDGSTGKRSFGENFFVIAD